MGFGYRAFLLSIDGFWCRGGGAIKAPEPRELIAAKPLRRPNHTARQVLVVGAQAVSLTDYRAFGGERSHISPFVEQAFKTVKPR